MTVSSGAIIEQPIASTNFIRRETAVSIVVNVALSLFFFLLIFGVSAPATVGGVGGYIFDFVPQGFMIGLMATLVPAMIAKRALRLGKVSPLKGERTHARLALRAAAWGLAAAGIGSVIAATTTTALELSKIDWMPALAAKLVFGGLVALVVTPPGLRIALSAR